MLLKINMAKSRRTPKSRKSPKSPKSRRTPKSRKSPKHSKSRKSKGSSYSKYIARCLKCKKNVKISGCKISKTVKGQPMVKGKCGVCGTKVNRFVKKGTKSC